MLVSRTHGLAPAREPIETASMRPGGPNAEGAECRAPAAPRVTGEARDFRIFVGELREP